MKYSRFEQLIIGVGGLAILGSLALSLQSGGPGIVEIAAQLLLFAVLVVAVHWGRRAGMYAAIAASLIYIAMRIPVLSSAENLTVEGLVFMVARIAAFGLVGIVGGEVCSRIKYLFARFDDSNTIDDWSRVYNQRHASRAIEQARARYTRYGEPFSLVVITLSSAITAGMTPQRQRSLVRAVANYLRDDIRMVDEVGRLDDGRFVVLLPHTPREGGDVVTARLASGVRQTVGAKPESVTATCMGAAEDTVALATLNDELLCDEATELRED